LRQSSKSRPDAKRYSSKKPPYLYFVLRLPRIHSFYDHQEGSHRPPSHSTSPRDTSALKTGFRLSSRKTYMSGIHKKTTDVGRRLFKSIGHAFCFSCSSF